jgi:pimeloyl-ACP methyl ester carboxylesterase
MQVNRCGGTGVRMSKFIWSGRLMRFRGWIALAAVLGAAAYWGFRKSPYERAIAARRAPSVFRSEAGRQRYEAAYDAMLRRWPIEPDSLQLQTRFGETHVLATGPAGAPPLVLLHAVSVSATEWYRNVDELSRHFRLYAIDAIGDCGRTEATILPSERAEYADWLFEVMEGLEVERAHVLGHSYGGFLAINFAVRYPERVDRLVLLAPAASIHPFRPAVRILLSRMGSIRSFRPSARATLQGMSHKGYVLDPEFVRLMDAVVSECTPVTIFPEVYTADELAQLKAPTLLLLGDQESIYDPARAAERAERHIPNIRTVRIRDAGHLLNMEQPEAVNREIVAFLRDRGQAE